jgi:hypothetical protein
MYRLMIDSMCFTRAVVEKSALRRVFDGNYRMPVGSLTLRDVHRSMLSPLFQLSLKCLEVVLSLCVSKRNDRSRIVHGKLESDILCNVLNADQMT